MKLFMSFGNSVQVHKGAMDAMDTQLKQAIGKSIIKAQHYMIYMSSIKDIDIKPKIIVAIIQSIGILVKMDSI